MLDIKKIIAKKMAEKGRNKPKSMNQYDDEVFKGKVSPKTSIYHGVVDKNPSNSFYKETGLSNYIKYMENAENKGKFKFDKRNNSSSSSK